MKKATLVVLLLMGGWLMAKADSGQSVDHKREQTTVQGCISRSSGDFVLRQFDPGNSYVLHSANKIALEHYLGEEVRIIGTEFPTLSDTDDTSRSTAPTTIMVKSINTISKECTP